MAIAPEPKLAACLRVLYVAALEARLIGYSGSETGRRWEEVDEPLLRGMLADFDRKWGHKSTLRLLVTYEDILSAA